MTLILDGYIAAEELAGKPGIPSADRRRKGPIAVIECIQDIPCNPCEYNCAAKAIKVGEDITNLPQLDEDKCVGCLSCIPICPGQAIFVVDESLENGRAVVVVPYEFSPLPEKGETVTALNRAGRALGEAVIVAVRKTKRMDQTAVVSMEVPREWSMEARAFQLKR